jgi:acyl-CoA synthetase (AMP-forming)/AMP-acid ligase II
VLLSPATVLDRVRSTLTEVRAALRVAPDVPKLLPYVGRWTLARLLERNAEEDPTGVALLFEALRITWREVDARASQYARFFARRGVGRGDVVALMMDNRPDYVFVQMGLGKLGAVGALLNTSSAGKALVHAIGVARPKLVIAGAEHAEAMSRLGSEIVAPVLFQAERAEDARGDGFVNEAVASEEDAPLASRHRFTANDPASYIYTSGTTGLPKAAVITNQRTVGAAALYARSLFEFTGGDVLYVTLPLYHASAQWMGWGSCALAGVTLALRRKFSASAFWSDARAFGATHFLYIGEICRYLLRAPPGPDDRAHKLRMGVGNGLRADVWTAFQERFGVPLMREFYGATEGNTLLVNLEGRPGMIGRIKMGQRVLRCDLATGVPVRDARGLCVRVSEGETGLLVSKLSPLLKFEGYVDEAATEKKILRDVDKRGDACFNSGDLLTLHEGGWLSFADRVGDTFRWKGENVSTNEVAEALNAAPGVLESNVYGVEVARAEGRAGMASLRIGEGFDLSGFARFVKDRLPAHQRPYFLRLQREMKVTGTFKHQKSDYRAQGYDPAKSDDPVFYLDGAGYVAIDAAVYDRLRSGEIAPR